MEENNNKDFVSIIIPAYNAEVFLDKTIQAILNQTYLNFELIICNDCSTDGTQAILEKFAKLDKRIILTKTKRNSGMCGAPRNRAIDLSNGEWIAFCDADDVWHKDKLKKQINCLTKSRYRAICSNAYKVREGKRIGTYLNVKNSELNFLSQLYSNNVICSTMVIHKDIIRKTGVFTENKDYKSIEDYNLWLKVAALTDIKFLNENLIEYYDNPVSTFRKNDIPAHIQRRYVYYDLIKWLNNNDNLHNRENLLKIMNMKFPYLFDIDYKELCNPPVTVVMPVHNGEKYIRSAIRSVEKQSLDDWELVIVDDVSDDGTSKILEQVLLEHERDLRVRIYRLVQRGGIVGALNKGLENCRSRFVARLDEDDLMEKDRLMKQISYLISHPDVIVCGSNIKLFGEIKQQKVRYPEHDEEIRSRFLLENPICHPAAMIRYEGKNKKYIRYNLKYSCTEDYELWSRLMKKGKFYNVQEILQNYRIHKNQKSQTDRDNLKNQQRLLVIREELKEIGIVMSKKEEELHSIIWKIQPINDFQTLKSIKKWMHLIIESNKKYKKYPQVELEEALHGRWFSLCFQSCRRFKISTYDIYKSLNLRYKDSSKLRYKQIVMRGLSNLYKRNSV